MRDKKRKAKGISIHALRGEGDTNALFMCVSRTDISIHALRGEGDKAEWTCSTKQNPFQSTPSVGRATVSKIKTAQRFLFQSTPSVGRATLSCQPFDIIEIFQSTPSVGRATNQLLDKIHNHVISIHALRGEGDEAAQTADKFLHISIHALRGEGDGSVLYTYGGEYISIHALRGEGDVTAVR